MNRIADYALIGDCHSAALVGRDGSIDWACFPRFDSPAVFCRALDVDRGGAFAVAPKDVRATRRWYIEDTNVLVTRFETESGAIEVTDCMPVAELDRARPAHVTAHHSILRRIRCVEGRVEVAVSLTPRFEYASFTPRFELAGPRRAEIVGGADALWVTASHPLVEQRDAISATWLLDQGEQAWIQAAWSPSHEARGLEVAPSIEELGRRLDTTISFWRTWLQRCWYEGEYVDEVRRSALALKAMTYAPTGAVIAAPTTSFPEAIGGGRNWDYRYTWIRDATLTLISLFILGFQDEADAFKVWLERTGAGRPEDLQIMYRIGGERSIPEHTLAHLSGHRDSAPVRTGNAAAEQMQLDAYGQILEAAYLYGKAGRPLSPSNWSFLEGLAEIVCQRWRLPDQGIWEIRDEPRHFVHSKLNCWLALHRAAQLSTALGRPVPEHWGRERDALRAFLIEEGASNGWFSQAAGVDAPDASTLLVPAVGFLPTTSPLVRKTIEVVRRDIERDGFVYRYLSPDGLAGHEGSFLLCSFWLVDCLTHAGKLKESESLLEQLLATGNDVGLFAEEFDPDANEPLGNFPQAFTHMAIVGSCSHLSAAKRGEIAFDGAQDYAELALDRLLAARG